MSRKDEIEVEVKRDMVQLLLNTQHFNFQNPEQVTSCAGTLADFILKKSRSQEPHGA